MVEEDTKRRRRIIIISVSTFLLVAMVVAVTVGVNFNTSNDSNSENNNEKSHMASTIKAVKTFCKPTDYKKECEESLLANVGNTTDSRELIKLAFNITVGKIGEGIKKTNFLQEVEKEPRAKMALDTCTKLMDLSIGEFDRSLERIKKFDLNNLESFLMSLKVWLSGAVTYQETCIDAFENTTSDASNKMKTILTSSMHMTSNALAIISDLADNILNLNSTRDGRQLIDIDNYKGKYVSEQIVEHDDVNEVPSWVGDDSSVGVRRLLNVPQNKLKADAVVAIDGSGKFKSINDALKLVPKKNQKPFIVFIKEGVYHEYVEVTKKMTHVVFFGEGPTKTRITGKKNFIDGINTYNTATVGKHILSFLIYN
jgi:pectinesterase